MPVAQLRAEHGDRADQNVLTHKPGMLAGVLLQVHNGP
jgi:hypothetical protein